jgi:hypothetical protein
MLNAPSLDHLLGLLDDTGIAQHATYAVVARVHGYCLDDNARGLLLAATLQRIGFHSEAADRLFARTAAFVQHAWNENTGRFRNLMSFDRRWLDDVGSEDGHGRALWALGTVARDTTAADISRWALEMVNRATQTLPCFTSPRAQACALLGVLASQRAEETPDRSELCALLGDRLYRHLGDTRRTDWVWFENSLSYDNARLAHAVIEAGHQTRRSDWQSAGLDALRWLCRVQTAACGCFSPIGNNGFWTRGEPRARFDQQPIEAAATVAAAICAWQATRDPVWLNEAERARRWFLGDNDLDLALVNARGACCDGLQPDRVNMNLGAESTLAWLQAEVDFQEVFEAARSDGIDGECLHTQESAPSSRPQRKDWPRGRNSISVSTTRSGSSTQ